MTNLIGLLIIILGLSLSYLGTIQYFQTFIFWIGFLLLLRPCKNIPFSATQVKCARIGLLFNILGTILYTFALSAIMNKMLCIGRSGYFALEWILSPTSSLFKALYPDSYLLSNGVCVGHVNYIRVTITNLLDICLYMGIGLLIGKLADSYSGKSKRQILLDDTNQSTCKFPISKASLYRKNLVYSTLGFISAIILIAILMLICTQNSDFSLTGHVMRTKKESLAHQDSTEIQYVGYATLTGPYTTSRNSQPSSCTTACTVIFENGRYYGINGWPEDYLRSLLDKNKFPLIAKQTRQKYALAAKTDQEAISEAEDILKRSYLEGLGIKVK